MATRSLLSTQRRVANDCRAGNLSQQCWERIGLSFNTDAAHWSAGEKAVSNDILDWRIAPPATPSPTNPNDPTKPTSPSDPATSPPDTGSSPGGVPASPGTSPGASPGPDTDGSSTADPQFAVPATSQPPGYRDSSGRIRNAPGYWQRSPRVRAVLVAVMSASIAALVGLAVGAAICWCLQCFAHGCEH